MGLPKGEKRFEGTYSDEFALNALAFPYQREMHKRTGTLIKESFPKKEIKILELGCGTGETTKEVALVNASAQMILIDNSNSMIDQAKVILKDLPHIKFIQADILEYLTNCDASSFDVVLSAYTIHNFTQDYRAKVIEQIHRVLKKEGIFLNTDIIYSLDEAESEKQFEWLANHLEKYIEMGRPDLKSKWLTHITEDRNPNRIQIEQKYIALLKSHGFNKVERIFRIHSDAIILAKK